MAQRYGGKYSPDQQRSVDPAEVPRAAPGQLHHPIEGRTTWVTLMATPMLLGAFFQGPVGMAMNLAGFGVIALAQFLTREGLKAEASYDARRVARRPSFPRKLFGSILTGFGIFVGAAEPSALAGAVVLGGIATVLHALAFGPDPMRDKGMEGIDAVQQDRAARMIDEAEGYLSAMSDAILRTRDRQLEARVNMFSATARDLFERVEQDPAAIPAARRYLGVYLMAAKDATVKFGDLYAQTRDPRARSDYESLLTDLEKSFRDVTARIREGRRADMDIEFEVLRDRLAREGVRIPSEPAQISQQPDPIRADDLFAMKGRAAYGADAESTQPPPLPRRD